MYFLHSTWDGVLYNGLVCKNNDIVFVLMYMGQDENGHNLWGMLYLYEKMNGRRLPQFISDDDNKNSFSEIELKEKFNFNNWIVLDGNVGIVKNTNENKNDLLSLKEINQKTIEDNFMKSFKVKH